MLIIILTPQSDHSRLAKITFFKHQRSHRFNILSQTLQFVVKQWNSTVEKNLNQNVGDRETEKQRENLVKKRLTS